MCVNRLQKFLQHKGARLGIGLLVWALCFLSLELHAESKHAPKTLLRFLTNSLDSPVRIIPDPSNTSGILIAERGGSVEIFDGKRLQYSPLLDIENLFEGEAVYGLLDIKSGISSENRPQTFFITYKENHGDVIVARFSPKAAGTSGERELYGILKIARLAPNNTHVAISADSHGNLYIATGRESSSKRAIHNNKLNPHPFDGTILRVRPTLTTGYTIPKRNPCRNSAAAKGEVWKTEIHNPLWLGANGAGGKLLLADKNKDTTEVYHASASECGRTPKRTRSATKIQTKDGEAPIIGGIYRGKEFPILVGKLLYGDTKTGTIFSASLSESDTEPVGEPDVLAVLSNDKLAAIGFDTQGRIYIASEEGKLWRLEPNR